MEEPFQPHENWAPELNRAHAESELQGGCDLDKVPIGGLVLVTTRHDRFVIEKFSDGYTIHGHKLYCPEPTRCTIAGSIYHPKGSMLRRRFIGRGMFMEFGLSDYPRMVSSEVMDVVEL